MDHLTGGHRRVFALSLPFDQGSEITNSFKKFGIIIPNDWPPNPSHICIKKKIVNQLKKTIMKVSITKTPTQSRKFVVFSNFKNSKRVRWAEYRNYSH